MSKQSTHARHRAVPTRTNPFVTASRAFSASASVAGKPAAVVAVASGLMLGASLPANAAGEVSTQPAAASTAAGTHTVQAGDTLGSIAAMHGVSLDALFAANGLGYASVIYPGQSISLGGSAAPAQYSVQSAPAVAAPAVAAPAVAAPAPAAPAAYSFQSTPAAAPAAASGIVATAMQGLGSGYVYGGTSFGAWDCSAFVQWVYAQHGIDLPRTTWSQFATMTPTSNPQPGDLVSQNGGGHVGIYLGDGQMISALNASQGTIVHSVNAMPVDGYYTR